MLKKIWKLSIRQILLVVKIICLLFSYIFIIHILPYKYIKRHFVVNNNQDGDLDLGFNITFEQRKKVLYIRKMINAVQRNIKVKNQCLAYALVIKKLLKKHHIPHKMVVGVMKEEGEFKSHAWVICDDIRIPGYKNEEKYLEIGRFGASK